jgi:hypothetical protein
MNAEMMTLPVETCVDMGSAARARRFYRIIAQ